MGRGGGRKGRGVQELEAAFVTSPSPARRDGAFVWAGWTLLGHPGP
jgi:hypothetical protein